MILDTIAYRQLFDERTGAINFNYIQPYLSNEITKSDGLSDSMVMRRPRRTRTTFTADQIIELENNFLQAQYITSSKLDELSAKLSLGTAQVKTWFKNRRRRQKIHSDQLKNISSKDISLSPPSNGVASNCDNKYSGLSSEFFGAADFQSFSLNSSGESTTNTLKPSDQPTANLMTSYDETVLNPYYYNNNQHGLQPHQNPIHSNHVSLTPAYADPSTQYYTPLPPNGSLQHHHHPQNNDAAHPHLFPVQRKPQVTSMKQNSEFKCDNPIDENSSLRNDVGSGCREPVDDSNETKAKLQIPASTKFNGNGDSYCRKIAIPIERCDNPANNIMNTCNGTFLKIHKMTPNTADTNYQHSIDTLLYAYNNRNHSTNTQQFATYCYN